MNYLGSDIQIANLSKRRLTADEELLLQLGLKFINTPDPSYTSSAPLQILYDIQSTFEKYIFSKSATFTLAQKNSMRKVFWDLRRAIKKIKVIPPRPNFTQRMRNALIALQQDESIIIAKADKGDTIVIMDSDHYFDLAHKHLADRSTYEVLESDPRDEIVDRYHKYLDQCLADKVLDKYQYNSLRVPVDHQSQIMYFLPKLHKHPLKLRPIVSSIGGITVQASKFIDRLLQPLMKRVPSYCKNSLEIVKLIRETKVPYDSYLATLDVESLYTNISFEMAITTFIGLFKKNPRLVLYLDLLKFVLFHNIFQFNGTTYRQICGLAMGTKLAPAMASLVVAMYEDEFLKNYNQGPLVWKRYIDDVLVIWPHSRLALQDFIEDCNRIHPNLKFTATVSSQSVSFLDVNLYKGIGFTKSQTLSTSIFFKETNTFSYLHGSSHISSHVLKGIAKGEIIRALRNTSNPIHFKRIKRALIKKFYQRKFPKSAIRAVKNVHFEMRELYMETTEKSTVPKPIPIRTKYYQFSPTIGKQVKESWERIHDDPVLSQTFPSAPFVVWANHSSLKSKLSYKRRTHATTMTTEMPKTFTHQRFNRPLLRKRSKTM